jgi:hypothetical protein
LKSATEDTDPSTELRVVLSLSKDEHTEPKRRFFPVSLVTSMVHGSLARRGFHELG